MGRGIRLSNVEMGQIDVLRDNGISNRAIAQKLGRSANLVNAYLKNPMLYGTRKSSGRPTKTTAADRRRIVRAASNSRASSRAIASELDLQVTPRTVRNVLSASPHIVRSKMMKAPSLSVVHKQRRLQFAADNVQTDWSTIIWSDEKKFNLDGPDGFRDYWHDLRKEKLVFSRRNFGGGGLMVWCGFCGRNKLRLAFVSSRMNSEEYQNMLEAVLIPFYEDHDEDGLVFQQDGAPPHRSMSTRNWLQARQIPTLQWPACSPDLNPVENVWGMLVTKIYAGRARFETVAQLKAAILRAWDEVAPEHLNNLIGSMPNRLFQIVNRQGGPTDY